MHNADSPSSAVAANSLHGPYESGITLSRRLQRVCAWCKRIATSGLEWREGRMMTGDAVVTHGICPQCAARFDQLP